MYIKVIPPSYGCPPAQERNRPIALGSRLRSTANIHTYTPHIYNTVYINLIRHCKHLLVVVYIFLSCIRVPSRIFRGDPREGLARGAV